MASSLVAKRAFASLAPAIKPYLPLSVLRTIPQLQLSSQQARSFTQTPTNKMSSAFLDLVKTRRSHYPLKKESPISDAKIQEIINESLLHSPSSFNCQGTRIVVLFGAEHDKLWEIVKAAIKAVVPEDAYPASEQKLNMFKGAYGTVCIPLLFFSLFQVVAALVGVVISWLSQLMLATVQL